MNCHLSLTASAGSAIMWRMALSPKQLEALSTLTGPAALAIPPESLDDRTQVIDPTERDPVEVSTFGVGSISPEAEAMRRGEML